MCGYLEALNSYLIFLLVVKILLGVPHHGIWSRSICLVVLAVGLKCMAHCELLDFQNLINCVNCMIWPILIIMNFDECFIGPRPFVYGLDYIVL